MSSHILSASLVAALVVVSSITLPSPARGQGSGATAAVRHPYRSSTSSCRCRSRSCRRAQSRRNGSLGAPNRAHESVYSHPNGWRELHTLLATVFQFRNGEYQPERDGRYARSQLPAVRQRESSAH